MPIDFNGRRYTRAYYNGQEIGQGHLDGRQVFTKPHIPVFASATVSPDHYLQSNIAPPKVKVAWQVSGATSIAVTMHVGGTTTALTPDAVNDGSVSLTAAQNAAPYNDHWGYRRQGIATGFAKRGDIADEATSLVQVLGGHRSSAPAHDNFHITWTGMPTSGSVYGRWVPNTGNSVDFTLAISNVSAAWNLYANIPVADPYYSARTSNAPFAGAYNSATGLPAGKFYLYEDAARTRQINLRTIPISDGSSVEVQLPVNSAWRYIRGYGFDIAATNAAGTAVAHAFVTRQRLPVINYFRVKPGSFRRNAFNNNHRWVTLEWQVNAWPRGTMTLAYAPGNTFSHTLSLTAANPGRRTAFDANDTGIGDDRLTITAPGAGTAVYRLTLTTDAGSVYRDITYNWPS